MKNSKLLIEFDSEADAAYVYFDENQQGKITATDSFKIEGHLDFGTLNIDFDKNGKIMGLEILAAKKVLPSSLIED